MRHERFFLEFSKLNRSIHIKNGNFVFSRMEIEAKKFEFDFLKQSKTMERQP